MNALVRSPDALSSRLRPDSAFFADLPDETPLEMPAQALHTQPVVRRALERSPAALRLGFLILLTAAMTAVALTPVYRVLAADTLGPLDIVIMVLVAMLFAWTAFSFLSALAGFFIGFTRLACGLGLHPDDALPTLNSRTAVLLPVYNEAPRAVFARLQAICESVATAGAGEHFDFFVLSDSTDEAIRAGEYGQFLRLKWRLSSPARLYYRHRPANVARKAGNIADWVKHFGGAYAHMVVLDADSLMEGETLVRLAAGMERAPDVGLIQTAPVIVNRHTLFARAEQFASRLYGPMLARGVAWWSGSEGNYWGHNAIIRVEAFAQQAGLPELGGRKPFGGHILSHDFVEAALLRRAGWRVCMAPMLGGSYEESPPTLAALLARDRRWCQGNLQHVQVFGARGLHWISRFHLLRGISSYLAAPLWLSLLVSGAMLPLHPQWGEQAGAPLDGDTVSSLDVAAVGGMFALSIGFLLAPKILAYLDMLGSGEHHRFGGASRAALNLAVETALSALIAPLIMISHTRSLAEVLAGRDSGWAAQAREVGGASLRQAVRLHAGDTVVGLILVVVTLIASPDSLIWMAPVVIGLTCAIPLTLALASARVARFAREAGLLLVPEEQRPPQILARANALSGGWPPS